MNTITEGDNYNILCPHCGLRIHYPCRSVEVPFRRVVQFTAVCGQCHKLVHFDARWELKVKAGTERI